MNDADRDFECALRSIAPTPATIDAAAVMREHVHRTTLRHLRLWQAAAAAALLVAAGLWAANAWNAKSREDRLPLPGAATFAVDDRSLQTADDPMGRDASLTWLAYSRALNRSAADFDALLSRQAATATPRGSTVTTATYTTPAAQLHALLGEM